MARIGYKKAKFNVVDKTTGKYKTVTEGVPKLERVIDEKFSPEFNSAELYADDVLAESDYSFKKGTLSITMADDDDKVIAQLLGNEVATETNVVEVTQKVSDTAPEIGYGHIVTKMVKGVRQYKVEFFPRVKVTQVTTDAKTRGDGNEFGTTALEATVMPLDAVFNGMAEGTWEMHQTFDTEAKAETYLDACLTPAT